MVKGWAATLKLMVVDPAKVVVYQLLLLEGRKVFEMQRCINRGKLILL